MSFQVSLENCQGFSNLDRGGKFIPPARNSEGKSSGKFICVYLPLYDESAFSYAAWLESITR